MGDNGGSGSGVVRSYPGGARRILNSTPLSNNSLNLRTNSDNLNVSGNNESRSFSRPLSRTHLQLMRRNNEGITLQEPRPSSQRHRNLYLGAPLPTRSPPTSGGVDKITAAEQVRLPSRYSSLKKSSHSSEHVITTQPSSILCPICRKCRCEACALPHPLPSTWVCSDSIHLSPETCLDYLSCLCCVKALFYHCGKNSEGDGGVSCADKPCSCVPHYKYWRWCSMGLLSLLLPCLCCYWPCRGVLSLVEKGYEGLRTTGCKCEGRRRPTPPSITSTTTTQPTFLIPLHSHSSNSNNKATH